MNAKVSTLLNPAPNPHSQAATHYAAVEDHARDVDKARIVIHDLRMELHTVIAELQGIASQIHKEVKEHQALINRAKATLLRTLPGGELDAALSADENGTQTAVSHTSVSAGRDALSRLDAMTPKQRRESLSDAITGMFGVKART